jgi:TldD protein
MDEDLARHVIHQAQNLGARYAEARLTDWQSSELVLKNGTLEATGSDRGEGLSARVLVGGNWGFLATNRLERDRLSRLVEEAVATARRGARKLAGGVTLSPEEAGRGEFSQPARQDPRDVSLEEKADALAALDRACVDTGANVPARLFSYEDAWVEKYYANSEGASVRSRLPRVEFYYSVTLLEAGESMQHYRYYAASKGVESLGEWKLEEELRHQVASMRRTIREGVRAPEGPVDVVLSPELVGIAVHESCGHPHEADRILGREAAQAGESWLGKDGIGLRVGSEHVTIVDDPTLEGSAGHYRYDDEGVKARRKTLVERGAVKGFLHNRESAARLGVASNASARASEYDKEPLVRMSNTFLLPGDRKDKEELFEDIRRGVFVNTFMEWNIDDRRENQRYVGNEAYLIEDGELTKPVKKPALELSTTGLWGSIDALTRGVEHYAGPCGKGEPMQGIPVWMGGPYARLRNIRLSVSP